MSESKTFTDEALAERGAPSFVWRAGQERRLAMIRQWGRTQGASILIDGAGLGMYSAHLLEDTPRVFSLDIEFERMREARPHARLVHVAVAEALPYADNSFDLLLSNEVIEHVRDDAQAVREMARVLRPGGRVIIFCPNRWYPFETHGHYWRGIYHFGNTPLINYLPNALRDRLAPHVRAYRWHDLQRLIKGLPFKVVYHTRIFGGYDNIIARRPHLGRLIRSALYAFERTPLRVLGLSHLLVLEKHA